jgi:hypothetical protein
LTLLVGSESVSEGRGSFTRLGQARVGMVDRSGGLIQRSGVRTRGRRNHVVPNEPLGRGDPVADQHHGCLPGLRIVARTVTWPAARWSLPEVPDHGRCVGILQACLKPSQLCGGAVTCSEGPIVRVAPSIEAVTSFAPETRISSLA